MKIAVFGSRDYNVENGQKIQQAFELLLTKLDLLNKPRTFLHGGARGSQEEFITMVKEHTHCDVVLFKPWTQIYRGLKFVPKMFFFRNIQILENSDLILVFTTGNPDSEVDKVLEWCDRHPEKEVIKVGI